MTDHYVSLRTLPPGSGYVLGEGPIDAIYADALYGAEIGDLKIVRGALRAISQRHHDTAEALARATQTEPDDAPTFHLSKPPRQMAWLIERGQAEKQVPTVWWVGDPEATSREGEDWTQDAYKATWFETKAAAEIVIERLLTNPLGASARATEHGFDG